MVYGKGPEAFTERDMAQWLECGALLMSLPDVRFRTRLVQDFQRNIMFLPSQSWYIVLMLCPWYDRDCNVYDKLHAPRWLQNGMLSVELKWHTNEQV